MGSTVSLSSDGTIVAIGAPYNDSNGVDAGHVRIYRNNSGAWVQIGEDIHGETSGDGFGATVSLNSDGTIVAIGAPYNDSNGVNAGQVRIYQNILGVWSQLGGDIEGAYNSELVGGWGLKLSPDGVTLGLGKVRYYPATFQNSSTPISSEVVVFELNRIDQVAAGTVSVDGVVEEGGALQAVTSITDADGAVSLSYQWQRSADGTVWTTLSGASDLSYTIPSDQSLVGETLRLVVISTDPLGGTTTFTSAATLVANVDDQAQGSVSMAGVVRRRCSSGGDKHHRCRWRCESELPVAEQQRRSDMGRFSWG